MDEDFGVIARPAWFDVLLAEVNRAFEVTGAETPGWPDPHPNRSPFEEEYSRIKDPGKYKILHSRVDAWAEVLASARLAEAAMVPPVSWTGETRPPDQHLHVRQFVPVNPGGLDLLLATTLVEGDPYGLDVGICRQGQRPVLLASLPVCGCDACDDGSAELLDELDGWVLTVARGGTVHARRGNEFATRSLDGWFADDGADLWLDESTPLASGVERWVGTSWVQE